MGLGWGGERCVCVCVFVRVAIIPPPACACACVPGRRCDWLLTTHTCGPAFLVCSVSVSVCVSLSLSLSNTHILKYEWGITHFNHNLYRAFENYFLSKCMYVCNWPCPPFFCQTFEALTETPFITSPACKRKSMFPALNSYFLLYIHVKYLAS